MIHHAHLPILLPIEFRIEVDFLVRQDCESTTRCITPLLLQRHFGKRPFSAFCTLTNQENIAERISAALRFLPPPGARGFFTGRDVGSLRSAMFSNARVPTLIAR